MARKQHEAKIEPGMRFGKLTVIAEVEPGIHGGKQFQCRCECGNELVLNERALKKHIAHSCGCNETVKDLVGQKFGMLTVLQKVDAVLHVDGLPDWICKCDCGNEVTVHEGYLKHKGLTQSCGCRLAPKPPIVVEPGAVIGKLTVLEKSKAGKRGATLWLCQCECGNQMVAREAELQRHAVASCGCGHKNKAPDIIGQRFGMLEVLYQTIDNPSGHPQWVCRCDCGNLITKTYRGLTTGKDVPNCGCVNNKRTAERSTTHGKVYDPLWIVWCGMKERCNNPNSTGYSNYGGRGIKVCDEWNNDFQKFYDDVHEGYEPGLHIDRIDINGNYELGNTRWVTPQENMRNKRNNVTIDSALGPMKYWELAEATGLPLSTLYTRHSKGYPDEFLTLPQGFTKGTKMSPMHFKPFFENGMWMNEKAEKQLNDAIGAVETQVRQKLEEQKNGQSETD